MGKYTEREWSIANKWYEKHRFHSGFTAEIYSFLAGIRSGVLAEETLKNIYHVFEDHGFCGNHMGSDEILEGTCAWKPYKKDGEGGFEMMDGDPASSVQ